MIMGLRKLRKYYATKIWSYTVLNVKTWSVFQNKVTNNFIGATF